MRNLFLILILTCFLSQHALSQLYFPLENYYSTEINRFGLNSEDNYYSQHLSMQPILDKRTNSDSIYYDNSKQYYWITQKLFKENFLIFEGPEFWCSVDPVLDLELGSDLSVDSTNILYWNTRGIRVQAKFMDKVGFSTVFYENQALVPDYQAKHISNHGEFFPLTVGYTQNNGVVPGYGRTKPFKTNGFDFAFAQGAVSYVPNERLNFHFGNGNHFIGNGYRSLLLSDFTTNYPFAKIETNWWNNRIQYNVIYAIHQNLYRLPNYTTPEANYEKKIGTYHYLDLAVTPDFQIGFFEGAVWKRSDSLGTHPPDYLFLNPIIYSNGLIKGGESAGYNAIFGINANYTLKKTRIYTQLVLDNKGISGMQFGFKLYDFLTPMLDVQIEYNNVIENTYLSNEKRYNYSHYNLPLAHPLEAGFEELLLKISYQKRRFFISNKLIYSKRIANDTINNGASIINQSNYGNIPWTDPTFVIYNQFELGYRFNKRYNLQAVAGYLFRKEDTGNESAVTNYVYFGIRTRLKNKTLDW